MLEFIRNAWGCLPTSLRVLACVWIGTSLLVSVYIDASLGDFCAFEATSTFDVEYCKFEGYETGLMQHVPEESRP